VGQLYDKKAAAEAESHFAKVVQNKEIPDEIPEYCISLNENKDLKDLMVAASLAKSRSEAGRLIEQGAVSIDGVKITGGSFEIRNGSIVKAGKRRFAKIINSDIM
jgi:tyrosyl-tRNA synthetase